MDNLPHRLYLLYASLKEANFIGNATIPELVDPKGQFSDGRKGDGAKEVSMRMNH
jgi:hypothetical protein